MATKPLSEYLVHLLNISGIKDEEVTGQLKEKLGDFGLSEEQQTLLNNNVLIKDAAKNNSEIRSHFWKESMDVVDKIITPYMGDLSDDAKTELQSLKTTDRLQKLFSVVNENYKKQLSEVPKGTGKEELAKMKEQYEKQIQELNNQVKSSQDEISQINEAHENKLVDMNMSQIIGSKDYSSKYDKSHALIVADTLIKKAIKEDNLRIVRDGDQLTLKTNDEAAADYYVNNEKATVDGYITKILSKNNLLAAQNKPEYPNAANGTTPETPSEGVSQMAEYYQNLKATAGAK